MTWWSEGWRNVGRRRGGGEKNWYGGRDEGGDKEMGGLKREGIRAFLGKTISRREERCRKSA